MSTVILYNIFKTMTPLVEAGKKYHNVQTL